MKEHTCFKALVQRLLLEFDAIKQLNSIVQKEIAEVVRHETHKAGHVLWKTGDAGDDGCYVILRGEVQIWHRRAGGQVTAADYETGSATTQRAASAILSLFDDGVDLPEPVMNFTQMKSRRPDHNRKHMNTDGDLSPPGAASEVHVKSLGVGVMFGEIALLESKPRFATHKCKVDCEFLCIKKDDFDRLMKHAVNRIRFKQLSGPMRAFLREYDFYDQLDPKVKLRVPEIMHFQRYPKGSLVYKEGEPTACVYIILTGWVNLYHANVPVSAGKSLASERGWEDEKTSTKIKCAAMLDRLHQREDYLHYCNWVEAATAEIATLGGVVARLGGSQMFGSLALVGSPTRTESVACATDCEVLSLDKDDLHELRKACLDEMHLALPHLVEPLLKQVPFFQSFTKTVVTNIAHCMRYYVQPRGQVLFWENDPPGQCYLLLTGEVCVWKKDGDETMETGKMTQISATPDVVENCAHVAEQLQLISKNTHFADVVKKLTDQVRDKKNNVQGVVDHGGKQQNTYRSRRESFSTNQAIMDVLGLEVAHLHSGIVFGEQALLDDVPRNATVTCEDICQLLVISRKDFDRVVKQDMLRAKIKQLGGAIKRLLREFELFKGMSLGVQDQLADIIHYYKAREGTLLFEQGDAPNHCYIILSGEVTIWKRNVVQEEGAAEDAEDAEDANEDGLSDDSDMELELSDATQRLSEAAALNPRSSQAVGGRRISVAAVESAQTRKRMSCMGLRGPKRPAVELASELARERCANLAGILAHVAEQGMSTQVGSAQISSEDDTMVRFTCDAVAALGSGTLFGELALLNDQPRGATISCFKDCEFLVVEKMDFDRLLKAELNASKEEKLHFLRTHVPGVRSLQPTIAERLLYYFNREIVPKNHVFIRQGSTLHGDIFVVWQGAVESYSHLPKGGLARQGSMLRGSIFGAVPAGSTSTFTVVATTSPCEVLHVKPEFRKHVPESVLASVRENMDQTLARRMQQCAPLMPMQREVHTLRRPSSQSNPRARMRKACLMPNSSGLFERVVTSIDHEVFELVPGETVAMKGQRPKHREKPAVKFGPGFALSLSNPSTPSNSRPNSRMMLESVSAPSLAPISRPRTQ